MRVIELSRLINGDMPGFDITAARHLATDGWNATTLTLYSHCGTHMDAPRHFLPDGDTIEQLPVARMIGAALVVNLAPVSPNELITIGHLANVEAKIQAGTRLLLRTDWHHRYGSAEYRHALPRISIDLAEWLVDRQVALIGVEPPSVADVDDIEEVTSVHQTLLRGQVVIVEGLINLDQITTPTVQFVALPLRIEGGDGSPVRAIAIED